MRSECLRRVLDQLTDAQQEALDTTGLALDAEGDCLDGKPGPMGYYRLEYDENDSKTPKICPLSCNSVQRPG